MSSISEISPSNTFTNNQKTFLDQFIKVLLEKSEPQSYIQKLGQTLLLIGIDFDDLGLVRWSLDNGSSAGQLLTPSHFNLANSMGFNIQTPMFGRPDSPNNIQISPE
jgi:hypothetical protein